MGDDTPVTKLSEKDLQRLVLDRLYDDIDPAARLQPYSPKCEKLKLGNFELDYIVGNATGITIIEFKVNAHHGTLGQLLLYPRAVQQALQRPVPISVVLITTHLDKGVVELMGKLKNLDAHWSFKARLAIGSTLKPELVDPDEALHREQYWDQAAYRRTQEQCDALAKLLPSATS